MDDKSTKARALAEEILKYAKDSIMVNMRFMDVALYRLKAIPMEGIFGMGTNGSNMFYDYAYVFQCYKKERTIIARDYLHSIFHCIFYHMYQYEQVETWIWDIACDIAVENAIIELNLPAVTIKDDDIRREKIAEIAEKTGGLTAEKLYRYYKKHVPGAEEANQLRELFRRDIHSIFWKEKKKIVDAQVDWKKISERIKTDMKTFSKNKAKNAGEFIKNLEDANKEKYNYKDFLKRFAVSGETVQVNDDEFDYIYYSYGLQLYHNMPLIEPLEYKDAKKIKEFVVAIDTSGSCSIEIIRAFLENTYAILKSTESYFRQINIHIVQCDMDIRSDVRITNEEEFGQFMKNIKIDGRGGTDFRPVFDYVEDLREKGEFENLKGLIYFTDGYGIFPEYKPDFDVAFIFLDEDDNRPRIPAWAIKVVLGEDEIMIENDADDVVS